MSVRTRLALAMIAAVTARSLAADAPATQPFAISVRDYGATGDSTTKDTQAFQKALDLCALHGGGEVNVPAGTYLIGSVQMGTRTTLRLEKDAVIVGSGDADDYPTLDVRWEGRWQPGRRALIYAADVDHIGIVGPGRIEGNAAMAAPQNPRGSVVLEPVSCTDVRWEGFTVTQGGNWATHPTYCTDVVIKDVIIRGRRDGIDVDSCGNVRIDGCDVDTGDDCISLKSGRGLNGARVGKPTRDVLITGCTLRGRNFACLGIGSETSAGVKNVRIEKTKMTAATYAVYIKTRIGRGGVTEDIVGDDLDVVGGGFLRINLTTAGNTNTADDPVEGPLGVPAARDLSFSNVRLSGATTVADCTQVSPDRPIENLILTHITGTATKGIKLAHVRDAKIEDVTVTGITGDKLSVDDVTGQGIDGAARYTPPPARGRTTRPR